MPYSMKDAFLCPGLQICLLLLLLSPLSSADISSCIINEDCLRNTGSVLPKGEKKQVDNTTYCCPNSSDYIDLNYLSFGNVTCQCKSANQKAAEYADETMGQGRSCNWGADCSAQENYRTTGDDFVFCCLGAGYPHTRITHFGNESVCRCQSGSFPLVDPGYYALPTTNMARNSGEMCIYNHGCADFPSVRCRADTATFCCYGSRGIQTVNDHFLNVTRCTCTNDFVGAQCASHPYQVPNTTDVGTHACKSGSYCQDTNSQFVCSHGDTVFCCPQQGVNLTIVNNIIASCTCVSSGHNCNVTISSSASNRTTVGLASKLLMFMATVLIFVFSRNLLFIYDSQCCLL